MKYLPASSHDSAHAGRTGRWGGSLGWRLAGLYGKASRQFELSRPHAQTINMMRLRSSLPAIAFEAFMSIHLLKASSLLASFILLAWTLIAQTQSNTPRPAEKAGPDYSGMYSFLRDGEFVQINIEEQGRVTGFVSRYGDTEDDHGVFLDHFFQQGKLEGNQLTFTTETVHGVSFEFRGTVERGEGKNPGNEAYYVLKGTLVENAVDAGNKKSSRSREVVFKIFPRDLGVEPGSKK